MSTIKALQCIVCGREYPAGDCLTCHECGPSEGILDVLYDYDMVASTLTPEALRKRPHNHWRYRELLPVASDLPLPRLQVGWTPVYDADRLAAHLGVRQLFLKDDGRNPTASFKDRASSVAVMKAIEFGYDTIACASTGNAASSLAGFAADVGLRSYIFVPERAPEPKVAQLLLFGANVVRVQGTYDEAYDLCMQAVATYGWYNRNCAVNPYLVEGKKTAGLEIGEQMAGGIPDWVAVSVGDGCTLAGIWKGLREMLRLRVIDRLPRLLAVQAEGSQAVARQSKSEGEPPLQAHPAETVADSICVAIPRNWRKAVRAVRESGGQFVVVPDEAILEALRFTPRLTGVFGEPAGVTGVAGVRQARRDGVIGAAESVLAMVTGNGLKDVQTATRAAGEPFSVAPDLEEFQRVVMGSKRS
jgi:threonine synthase